MGSEHTSSDSLLPFQTTETQQPVFESEEIEILLSRLELSQYSCAFREAGLDRASDLKHAKEEDLIELGVKKFHVRRLLDSVPK